MSVKALAYVVVETTQPEEWDRFLTQVAGAMRGDDASDGAALYRVDDRPFRFRIECGASDRLVTSGFEVQDEASLHSLAETIRSAGRPVTMATPEECALRGAATMFRTSDPADNGLEFFHGDTRTDTPFVSPVGVPHFVTGELGMGHTVLPAPNFDETVAFYCDVIGFGQTDMPRLYFGEGPPNEPGVGFAFLHTANGRHHSLALGEVPATPARCIHLMLEMPDLIEVGKAHDRMRQQGFAQSASLGRHVNDEMTSFYVQTPAGFDLEIGCDGLVIDPASWATTHHEQISVWGHSWAWQEAMKKDAK